MICRGTGRLARSGRICDRPMQVRRHRLSIDNILHLVLSLYARYQAICMRSASAKHARAQTRWWIQHVPASKRSRIQHVPLFLDRPRPPNIREHKQQKRTNRGRQMHKENVLCCTQTRSTSSFPASATSRIEYFNILAVAPGTLKVGEQECKEKSWTL